MSSYARRKLCEKMMLLIWEMRGETKPGIYAFGTVLAVCASISALETGRQIHGFLIRNGYQMDVFLFEALMDMYSKCRCIEYALRARNYFELLYTRLCLKKKKNQHV